MNHPYKTAPSRAFWSRAVSQNFRVEDLANEDALIQQGQIVGSAGSCFASNIVPSLIKAGIQYCRTELMPSIFNGAAFIDNYGYSQFSAAYGNIYTVRHAVQLLNRALGRFCPEENCWIESDNVFRDPFRPGLRFPASSMEELVRLTAAHLHKVTQVFSISDVFVFTLGLTEAWVSRIDGAVFPACPGTIAGQYDPTRHAFKNFTAGEVASDLNEFVHLAREINPRLRFVLTVSPVPLVATATTDHVVTATIYSKSVLRVAAQDACSNNRDVIYFPAYEIVTGPQAPENYFESDRREPSMRAIHAVVKAFLSRCSSDGSNPTNDMEDDQRASVVPLERQPDVATDHQELARLVAERLCEEAALDVPPVDGR